MKRWKRRALNKSLERISFAEMVNKLIFNIKNGSTENRKLIARTCQSNLHHFHFSYHVD